MSQGGMFSELVEGDRIDFTELQRIISEELTSADDQYAVPGSLLEYMIDEHSERSKILHIR